MHLPLVSMRGWEGRVKGDHGQRWGNVVSAPGQNILFNLVNIFLSQYFVL